MRLFFLYLFIHVILLSPFLLACMCLLYLRRRKSSKYLWYCWQLKIKLELDVLPMGAHISTTACRFHLLKVSMVATGGNFVTCRLMYTEDFLSTLTLSLTEGILRMYTFICDVFLLEMAETTYLASPHLEYKVKEGATRLSLSASHVLLLCVILYCC